MRRIRIMGLCLVAMFAMGAIASGTASATAPEFGQCLKKAVKSLPGYSDSKCTKVATEAKKGTYEWIPGPVIGKNKFTTIGGVATLLTVKGETVTCTKEESTGHYIEGGNNKEEETTVRFKGCESNKLSCTTAGEPEGELVTNPLVGVIGFEKAPKKTALLLHPQTGSTFIAFNCTPVLSIVVRGKGANHEAGILAPIKNGKMVTTEILKYKQSKGKQKPTQWEGLPSETYLESEFVFNGKGTGFSQSGQTVESKVTNEVPLAINVVV